MATVSDSHRDHWLDQAAKIARRLNTGWWLETLAAPLVIAATVGACALLLIRRNGPPVEWAWLAGGIAMGLALVAGICWLFARRKFESRDQALVRLEASMLLRNALSAAKAGVAPWPAPIQPCHAGVRWNWPRLVVPALGSVLLLLAGLFLPVSKAASNHVNPDEPLAWKSLESSLDELTKDAVVDEQYLEETRKKLEEMRTQPEEEWFSHASLEATDSLKKSHQGEIERLERELGRADKAMGDLQQSAQAGGPAEQARLANEFDQAMQGLQNGAMKPNPDLLRQLQAFDPKNLGKLSPEQLQQLREGMKKACKSMQGQCEKCGGGDSDWADQLLAGENGQNGNEEGEGAGKGGVDRGPGHSPGVLGKESQKTETGNLTGLEAKDLSRAMPGDLLELQDGEHQIDRAPTGPKAGGDTEATGQGGDRVWKDSLDPAEQRAMKRFFE
jgi:hypothetical protein